MINKINNLFLGSGLEIIDKLKLKKYIAFCYENNLKEHTPFLTEHHHILPQSANLPFTKYSDIKNKFKWNGVYLSIENHFIAHKLLAESVNHISISSSYMAMCYIKNITPENFAKVKIQNKKNHSKWLAEKSKDNPNITNAEKIAMSISKTKQSSIYKNEIEPIRKKKFVDTMKNTYIDNDGNITTKQKELVKKRLKTIESRIKRFKILHINGDIIEEDIKLQDLKRKYSPTLHKASKEKYLGFSIRSKLSLNKANNLHLVGLFAEQIN